MAAANSNRGYVKGATGDSAGAIADYDRAIGLNPKNTSAYQEAERKLKALGAGAK